MSPEFWHHRAGRSLDRSQNSSENMAHGAGGLTPSNSFLFLGFQAAPYGELFRGDQRLREARHSASAILSGPRPTRCFMLRASSVLSSLITHSFARDRCFFHSFAVTARDISKTSPVVPRTSELPPALCAFSDAWSHW